MTDRRRRNPELPGDGGEFDAVYQRHYAFLYGYSRRRLPDQAAAQDVVAEVFLTAWRHRRDLPSEPDTRLWLTRVAYRAVGNSRRSARRASLLTLRLAREPAHPDPGVEDADPQTGRLEQVRAALERLPAADRELLRLALWEQLTLTEISQVLGITPNAAGVRLHRARQRLHRLLTPDSPAAGEPPHRRDPVKGRNP